MVRIIQCNLNRNRPAQDLLTQFATETEVGICILSEPARIMNNSYWFGSLNKLAAVYWRPQVTTGTGVLLTSSRHCVAVKFKELNIISCYVSPNSSRAEFLEFLDELGDLVRAVGKRTVVAGDFNSKSTLWGSSRTNDRGTLVEDWAAECDLRLINTGSEPTCVRTQGSSIIDLTWVTPDLLREVHDWKVIGEMENLSDHSYIVMDIGRRGTGHNNPKKIKKVGLGWNWRKADIDKYCATLLWHCVADTQIKEETPAVEFERWLRNTLTEACDNAAPRRKPYSGRKQVYWWSENIADCRRECIRRRRAWMRGRRRRASSQGEVERYEREYRVAKKKLRLEINKAKSTAWQELIDTIEEDPWGLPYRIVLNKLRGASTNIMESLDEASRNSLVDSLFPTADAGVPDAWENFHWNEEWEVIPIEVSKVLKRKGIGNTAPGIDGITSKMLRALPEEMIVKLAAGYTLCLRDGLFPTEWKRASLVLIPKGGESSPGIPKVRPICLLSEVGKTFERVIVGRISDWMKEQQMAQLSDDQYGFRENRSTCDALIRVKKTIEQATKEGGYAVAVSLDIKNAFNSIPWGVIRQALIEKGFPDYLRRIIDSYLDSRSIEYSVGLVVEKRAMLAGVPQGSVLGPTLWNIAYDSVLQLGSEYGCQTLCYADDTLVLASGDTAQRAVARANLQVGLIINRIKRLGLSVSAAKTEVVLFSGSDRPAVMPYINVDGEWIRAGSSMKYLGIILDHKLRFREHFQYVVDKATRVNRALGRLMPNLRGPGENKRRLYANVLLSILLYGAPIWSEALALRRNQYLFSRLQRSIAIRMISGYRTVSMEAATLLSRIPPIYILAASRRRIYERVRDLRSSEEWSKEGETEIKLEEDILLRRQWDLHLRSPNLAGTRTREAVLPNFHNWLNRRHGSMAFHLTQLLTGHGCFGTYLYRINKVASPICEHCEEDLEDSAEHTLRECRAWQAEREALQATVGVDLSLGNVISELCRAKEAWTAMTLFAEKVMLAKEDAERRRQEQERRVDDSDQSG